MAFFYGRHWLHGKPPDSDFGGVGPPFYWLAEWIPFTREGARRLGLVTVKQMLNALAAAVERPAEGVKTVEVPAIREAV